MSERRLISRRDLLKNVSGSFGWIALGQGGNNFPSEATNQVIKLQIIESEVDLMSIPYDQYMEIAALISLPVDKVPIWTKESKPVHLSIRKIDYQSDVVLGKRIPDGLRHFTYSTPDSGIATPEDSRLYPSVLIY